jgi:co-chaperonin GroES (HSP10)
MSEKDKIIENFTSRALNFNVILKEITNENINSSGLDISKLVDKNEKFKKGFVVSIGENCPGDTVFKPGETVLFDSYKSSDLTIGGVLYKHVYYADLLLVL